MFRRLHHLNRVNSILSSEFKYLSSSALKFKLLPTGSYEIRQFRRQIVASSTNLYCDCNRDPSDSDAVPNFIPTPNTFYGGDSEHLKVDLYPSLDDPILNSIVDSTSMQEVFDIFTTLKENSTLNEKHSSQCLVTLWDHQKFMFQLGHLFDPSFPYMNRGHYVKILRKHPVFNQIIDHVMENYRILEDEPLSACLLVFKRFDFAIRQPNSQKMIEELLKRKSSLEISAVSRLCVCVRNESYYGSLVVAQLTPLLHHYARTVTTDADIRSTSIALRSSFRCQSASIITAYKKRLSEIWLDKSITSKLEAVTLCKIVMFLYDSLPVCDQHEHPVENCVKDIKEGSHSLSAATLLRNYGNLLAPKVSEMKEMDIFMLYKFILHQPDPVKLIDAISNRVLQLAETNPSLDIMTCVQPKNMEQKIKLASYLNNFLDNCTYFSKVSHLALRILFKINTDRDLYDKYWAKIVDNILNRRQKLINDVKLGGNSDELLTQEYLEVVEDHHQNDSDTEDIVNDPPEQFRILTYTNDYLNFIHRTNKNYSNSQIENLLLEEILQILKDIEEYKLVLKPSGYAMCLAFLIYMNYPNIQYKWSERFIQNFRIRDLMFVQKALDLRWKRKDSYVISNMLNRQGAEIIKEGRGNLHPFEYLGLAKLSVEFQKNFESSPNFIECLNTLGRIPWDDSRLPRELMTLVMNTGYYDPVIFERVSKFICDINVDVPLICAEKFAFVSFLCSAEGLEGMPIAAQIIKRNISEISPLPLLQAMISFCYHGCLDVNLINHVFDVEFLDQIDRQIQSFTEGSFKPMKIRQAFMELNRAVCIDKPEANIPWFHQKFCTEVASVSNPRETYLHREVGQVLEDLLEGQLFQKNVYSPYFYFMDFLLQFDKHGNPVKPSENNAPRRDVATKVAVLLHNPKDFTTNIRRLKGTHKLKKRHLEMLGYRVIHVDPLVWNSMGMSEKLAKNNYLNSCIFNRSELP